MRLIEVDEVEDVLLEGESPDGRRTARHDRDAAAAPPALVDDLARPDIERLLDLAASLEAVGEREVKKLPTLRGRTVVNVFFESSTRTSSLVRARRQAALRRRHVDQGRRQLDRQGRVAEGHDPDARRVRARRRS